MATLERTYTVPLHREYMKVPKHKRSQKAVRALRAFLVRHMKTGEENIRIGAFVNQEIWKNGIRNPPSRVKITAVKDDDGIVKAELFGKEYIDVKAEIEKQKKAAEKKKEKKTEEKKADEKKKAAEKKEEKTEDEKEAGEKKETEKGPEEKKNRGEKARATELK